MVPSVRSASIVGVARYSFCARVSFAWPVRSGDSASGIASSRLRVDVVEVIVEVILVGVRIDAS
ncbi:MAG: hypothetical protein RML12_07100 [Xanthomonadales bacterium]|nr:hypothetical protein [Xanthomonadales bacterium]